jgi:hypothetical protein
MPRKNSTVNESLEEAKKDPQFRKDIRKFIKATTNVYKF